MRQKVFDLITEMAWTNGEPGIVFLDKINAHNPVPALGEIESTNPCGEQPLLPYGKLQLRLHQFKPVCTKRQSGLRKPGKRQSERLCIFLDNVIDVNSYPLENIDKTTKTTRKIGLGVMGFADMLYFDGHPVQFRRSGQKPRMKSWLLLTRRACAHHRNWAQKEGALRFYGKSIYKKKPESLCAMPR